MSDGLPRQNLKDHVAEVVRGRILDRELAPGARIDQNALAAELGVSKLPVREALIQLELIGLVHNAPYSGAFVVELAPDELRDSYRIYGMVCGLAAERAAGRLTAEELARLDVELDRIDASPDGRGIDDAHMAFHRIINRAGSSRPMRRVISQLYDSLPVRTFDFTHLWLEGAQRDHRRMLQLLRAGDAASVAAATVDHFVAGGERVIEALAEHGYWARSTHASTSVAASHDD